MKNRFQLFISGLALAASIILGPVGAHAAGGDVTVTAEQWSRISLPKQFMALNGLRDLILEFNQKPGSNLLIHYQGGENGLLWAQQFRNRLVALGVESNRIQLIQGVTKNNSLVVGLQ